MSDDYSKFIDGSWYEDQYATEGSRYDFIYGAQSAESRDEYLFHAHFVAAMLCVRSQNRLLELGAGVGRFMRTWEGLGLQCQGVEISETAIKRSQLPTIKHCSAAELPFPDDHFHYVFSSAFLEHIAPGEETAKVLRESMRVARWGAHYIPMEVGDDPSHIHIQSREAWVEEILTALGSGFTVSLIENPCSALAPLFIIARVDDAPWPLQHAPSWKLA